jgi:hypothetical protein
VLLNNVVLSLLKSEKINSFAGLNGIGWDAGVASL